MYFSADELLDCVVAVGLFLAEVVARERENHQSLIFVLLIQRFQALVLRREDAVAGDVHDQQHLAAIGGERHRFAVDGERNVIEDRCGAQEHATHGQENDRAEPLAARLKFIAQSKLHLARRHRVLILAESAGIVQRQAGLDEVHVVKRVIGFRAELDAVAFPRQRERLRDADIEVDHAGQPHQRPRSNVPRILIRKIIRRVGGGEQARVAVAVVSEFAS